MLHNPKIIVIMRLKRLKSVESINLLIRINRAVSRFQKCRVINQYLPDVSEILRLFVIKIICFQNISVSFADINDRFLS